jgi:hypothetical protein
VVGGAAGAGQPEPGPAGQPPAAGAVQRTVGDHHHDARAGLAGAGRLVRRRQQLADVDAADREPVVLAEVRQHECPDGVTGRQHPGRRADTALPAEAGHAGARADGTLVGREGRAHRRAGGRQRLADVGGLDLHPAGVGQEGVVALGHQRQHDVLHPDRRVLGREQLAGRVEHPAHLHGGGEEDRRLGQAPLLHRQEAGALPGAVEHRATCRHRVAEQVAARVEHGHSGARDPATVRGRRLVPPHRGVPDADTGHVEHGAGGAGRVEPDPDWEISSARHA